jgi:SAM-dependent methyltransferase
MTRHLIVPSPGAAGSPYPYPGTLEELNRSLSRASGKWATLGRCPVCSSASIRRFAVIRHFRHSRCGLVFVNPVPPDDVLRRFYNSVFYANYRLAERDRAGEEPYHMISMYTDKYALAERVASRNPQSVLDYGCGSGAFLALLRDKFGISNAEGIEISSAAREVAASCYSLRLAESPAGLSRQAYDFVLLLEVIEHVPDPVQFFSGVCRLIAPDGHVLITTPAVDSFLARRPRLCPHYTAPSHLSLFTAQALHVLLDRSGFEEVEMAVGRPAGIARKLAVSAVYDMDFLSPLHQHDSGDLLYRPNALGRICGFTATRNPVRGHPALRAGLDAASRIRRVLPRGQARPAASKGRPAFLPPSWSPRGVCKPASGADHVYIVARRKPRIEGPGCAGPA